MNDAEAGAVFFNLDYWNLVKNHNMLWILRQFRAENHKSVPAGTDFSMPSGPQNTISHRRNAEPREVAPARCHLVCRPRQIVPAAISVAM
ncbi:MAG: hypothetical protein CFE33_21015 [Pseudorhodobacter sp. PARRP1]|nr:MAG: hypothetical protein CFE33_21015 [Pseudorhodobacter sp. PARRP1]